MDFTSYTFIDQWERATSSDYSHFSSHQMAPVFLTVDLLPAASNVPDSSTPAATIHLLFPQPRLYFLSQSLRGIFTAVDLISARSDGARTSLLCRILPSDPLARLADPPKSSGPDKMLSTSAPRRPTIRPRQNLLTIAPRSPSRGRSFEPI